VDVTKDISTTSKYYEDFSREASVRIDGILTVGDSQYAVCTTTVEGRILSRDEGGFSLVFHLEKKIFFSFNSFTIWK